MNSVFRTFAVFAVAAASVLSAPAKADPIQDADALFAQRTAAASPENEKTVTDAILAYDQALAAATDADVKYDILVKEAYAYYFLGNFAKGDDAKMKVYDQGMDKAKAARELNDAYAEAHYYYAINLGKWALAKGIMASLGRKKELMQSAQGAIDRKTRGGQPGETLDGYGPHRTLGRMYYKLPGFAGGNRGKALQELELALAKAPSQSLNTVYLAETLGDGNGDEKKRARQMLEDLIKFDGKAAEFNPSRPAETQLEIDEGKAVRRGLGN